MVVTKTVLEKVTSVLTGTVKIVVTENGSDTDRYPSTQIAVTVINMTDGDIGTSSDIDANSDMKMVWQ